MPHQRPASASLEFLPDFGRSVSVAEFDRPGLSDEIETAQTIHYMDGLAAADSGRKEIVSAAHDALTDADLDETAGDIEKLSAVFWWLKRHIRYERTPGTSPLVDQTLITPAALLAMPDPAGDCPQFSMLAKAMFRNLCMPAYFVTIATDTEHPDEYSHVYNAVVANGRLIPFDSSNGPCPGAEYARPIKKKVWPLIDPATCNGPTTKEATDMYRSTMAPARMRNAALRARLGDFVCDDNGCYDDGSGSTSTIPVTTSPTSSGSSGINWNSLLTSAFTDATQIGSQLIKSGQTPYYTTNAAGQRVLFNPATGISTPTATTTALNANTLLIGAAALVAVLALSRK